MSKTIGNRVSLGAVLVAVLSTSTAMAGDPSACGNGVLGTPEEIAATPRDDVNLELLALYMGSGITASQQLYDRVRADVRLVRDLIPEVADVGFRPRDTGRELILELDAPTFAAVESGAYDGWDCLNDYYGFESSRVLSRNLRYVVLRLKGIYDTTLLGRLYQALPGIVNAWPNSLGGDSSTICGIADSSSAHHYFFVEAHGDCLAGCIYRDIRYLTARRPGVFPELQGRWSNESGDPEPPWLGLYKQCEFGRNPLPARVDSTPAAPEAGEPVVLTVSGDEGDSACGPFYDGYEVDLATRTIRVTADYNASCGACTAAATPYAFDVELGGLAAGDYRVSVSIRDGCESSEQLLAVSGLTVRTAEVPDRLTAGNTPAATLLVPYFEVDLADPEGPTTIFSVSNAGAESTVAHVVLWTDWGLPTLAFDLGLGTDDIRTIDLRSVLARGELPLTRFRSRQGASRCTDPITLPDLGTRALAELKAKHTGLASSDDGLCYGSRRPTEENLAVGYVTVDAMNGCSESVVLPSDDGYFEHGGGGLASNRNVLWGDVIYLNSADDSAQGVEAVPILADASRFEEAFSRSFYGSYVNGDGRDNRVPLGHRYRTRFLAGGGAGMSTEVIVWTEGLGADVIPQDCGNPFPPAARDAQLIASFLDQNGDAAGAAAMLFDERTRKLAVGKEPLVPAKGFGQIVLGTSVNCNICGAPDAAFSVPTWVTTVLRAAGRFSAAQHATRIDEDRP